MFFLADFEMIEIHDFRQKMTETFQNYWGFWPETFSNDTSNREKEATKKIPSSQTPLTVTALVARWVEF